MNPLDDDIIVLKIFSFFSARKLNSLAAVSKSWQRLASETLANRKSKLSISLFDSGKWSFTSGIEGIKHLEIDKKEFCNEFKKSLSKLMVQPQFFLYLLTDDYFIHQKCVVVSGKEEAASPGEHPEITRKKNFAHVAHLMSSSLPKQAIKLFICTDFIVAASERECVSNQIEQPEFFRNMSLFSNLIEPYRPHNPSIGCLALTASPNYRFSTFQLINQTNRLGGIKNEKDLLSFFNVAPDESLRLILIFVNDFFDKLKEEFTAFFAVLNQIKVKKKNMFVLAGGKVTDLVSSCHKREYKYLNEEITFVTLTSKKTADECVKIAQFFVASKDEYNSEESDESDDEFANNQREVLMNSKLQSLQKLTWLKDADQNNGNMFTLFNANTYSKKHNAVSKEASMFKSLFPNIQLYGLYCHSQFAHDFFPGESGAKRDDISKSNDIKYYEDGKHICTVFTVVSLA